MCGICGLIRVDADAGEALDPAALEAMTAALVHRGPDDCGLHVGADVAFGARRLSIVDVAGGHQPVASEDGEIVAMQNGELYNHLLLRTELERDGHTFRSRCDTEILPHLYERDGDALPERLRGKFAVAVWDARNRRALIARDRLGVKPLYWTQARGVLAFSSELRSLLASGLVRGELDYEAIHAYLTLGFVPAPRTPLLGVSKLPPGHRLVVERGTVRVEEYWRYPAPAPVALPEAEHRERLLAKLEEAVRLRLMSDVPLGAMLSGGLDSSLVVALMARNMDTPVRTFSVGFREAGAASELPHARLVAERLGTQHTELELSMAEAPVDLEELVWTLDEPVADLSALGFLCLSGLASQSVTVALSGQGADELLGGYAGHRNAAVAGAWQRLPGPARRLALQAATRGPASARRAAELLAHEDAVGYGLAAASRPGSAALTAGTIGPLAAAGRELARRAVEQRLAHADGADPLARTLFLDAQLGLPDDMLHYFDRASMAHSLEVRVPFLDHELVELCATIPSELKVRRLRTKHLLKAAAAGLVPDEIVNRRKVGFFNAAVDGWLRAQAARAGSEPLLSLSSRCAELFDRRALVSLVGAHRDGTDPHAGATLLSLLVLELWLTRTLPRALALAPRRRDRVAAWTA